MYTGTGVFIVIEGTDGSGKGTQFSLLADKLTSEGYDVATFDFPQYDLHSSYFVREYLNGRYGTAEEVGPYTGSLFYALDRFEAAPKIRQALEEGKIVLANRYVGSNMGHQGTKFQHAEERRGYFIWLDNLEFEMLKIPRPTLSFVLRVPAETAQELVDKKSARSYTDLKRDLHEADLDHLTRAVNVFDEMCQLFPKDFSRIDCVRDGQLLGIDAVHDIIWQKVQPMLAPPHSDGPGTVTHPMAHHTGKINKPESKADVPTTATPTGPREQAISGSQLLLSKIRQGRHTHYIGESLTTVKFDQKDEQGNYRYFTPERMQADIETRYRDCMDQLFSLYAEITRKLIDHLKASSSTSAHREKVAVAEDIERRAHDIARGLLPVAAVSTLSVQAMNNSLENVVRRLLAETLPEAHRTVEKLLSSIKTIDETFVDTLNKKESGLVITYRASIRQKIGKLARKHLTQTYATTDQTTYPKLVQVWPRNELAVLPDMLYAASDLSHEELQAEIEKWSYSQKLEVFETYIGERTSTRQRPGRALEKIHYTWEIVSDFATFCDLQAYVTADNPDAQLLTPRLGYAIPSIIEEAGLEDMFESAFDLSLTLYSLLQEAGYSEEAQYATLLGHKMRWTVTLNARETFQFIEGHPDGTSRHEDVHSLVQILHDRLSQVHPIIGEAIKFAASRRKH